VPNIYNGKGMISSKYGSGKLDIYVQKNLLRPCNITQKSIKDLNIRRGTLKVIEENIQERFCDIGLRNDFLVMQPKHRQQNQKLTSRTKSNL
jgi:hypothetical protein